MSARTASERSSPAPWLALCALALSAAATGCGAEETGGDAAHGDTVRVHPRLVMDGLVDLASREQGHVQITEVVFHAPEVTHEDALGSDVIAGAAQDNLVFRYAAGSDDGFGDVLGGEREWHLSPAGELVFGFAPASKRDVAALSRSAGVDLGDLVGETAYVRGTVAVQSSAMFGSSCGAGEDADGDPDTSPAACKSSDTQGDAADTRGETDPDTSPADGTDQDGDTSESDPDTSPADSDPDTSPADSDPDTSPADSDPDTSPADSDPDTSPADSDPDTSPARTNEAHATDGRDEGFAVRPDLNLTDQRSVVHVPFLLVIRDVFTLSRPVAELRIDELRTGEVLPIELHVEMDELFTPEQIDALDKGARAGSPDRTVVVEAKVSGAVNLQLDAKAVKKVVERSPGIRVVGDLR